MNYTNEKWVPVPNGDGTWHIAPKSAFRNGKRHFQDKVADGISSEKLANHIVKLHNSSVAK